MTDQTPDFVVLPQALYLRAGTTTLFKKKQLPGRIGKLRSNH